MNYIIIILLLFCGCGFEEIVKIEDMSFSQEIDLWKQPKNDIVYQFHIDGNSFYIYKNGTIICPEAEQSYFVSVLSHRIIDLERDIQRGDNHTKLLEYLRKGMNECFK